MLMVLISEYHTQLRVAEAASGSRRRHLWFPGNGVEIDQGFGDSGNDEWNASGQSSRFDPRTRCGTREVAKDFPGLPAHRCSVKEKAAKMQGVTRMFVFHRHNWGRWIPV